MTKLLGIEALITSYERWIALFEQKPRETLVLYAFPTDVAANQESSDPPATQDLPLALENILVQDNHEAWLGLSG